MSKPSIDPSPVVLITGCSSGLGLALAKQLASLPKYRVVVTARHDNIAPLQELFQVNDRVMVRELDVLNDENIGQLVNEVSVKWARIDVLVNNAGLCFRAVIEHMDIESEMLQLKTNYLGPMSLMRAVLPIMREQRNGHIINISSVSGMVSMPTMASYSASKHALEGATEALWYEAKPYGIRVSLVEPGFIHSESFKRVILSKKATLSAKLKGPHSEYYDSMAPFIERLMRWSRSTPEDIAGKIVRLIESPHPPLRLPVTVDARVFAIIRKLLPARMFHRLMFHFLPGSRKWGMHFFRLKSRSVSPLKQH